MSSQTFTIIASAAAAATVLAWRPVLAQTSAPPSTPEAAAAASAPANDGPTRAGQTMYRWVDKDKTVHYSDRPQPGAESVPVQSTQTYAAPKAPATTVRSATPSSAPPVASCVITAPTADQVFPNAQSVTVSYTGPKGGKAELLLNGASRSTQPAGSAFTISPVPRGTYSATVAITSDTGAALCRTPSVTFHVTQPSLLSPVRRQMNRPQPR
jgi:Domain of unknown function (DUF4124)